MVGLERERRKGRGADRAAAGVRSFSIVALLGALAQAVAVAGLVPFGRIAIIAAPVDGLVQLPALALYRKGGSVVGINSLLYGVQACAAMLDQFGRFFDQDLLPLPQGLFESPLAEGLERYAEVNQGSGDKVILLP